MPEFSLSALAAGDLVMLEVFLRRDSEVDGQVRCWFELRTVSVLAIAPRPST